MREEDNETTISGHVASEGGMWGVRADGDHSCRACCPARTLTTMSRPSPTPSSPIPGDRPRPGREIADHDHWIEAETGGG